MTEIWRAKVYILNNNLSLWLLIAMILLGALVIHLYTSKLKRYESEEGKEAQNPLWQMGLRYGTMIKKYIQKRRQGQN